MADLPGPTPVSPEIQLAFEQILAGGESGEPEPTPEERERFLRGYSMAALVYNAIYFKVMKDTPFFWVSLICGLSVFGLPVLLILPFFARRRAYEGRAWLGFGQFRASQRRWERAGWVGLVVIGLLIGLWYVYFLPQLEGAVNSVAPGVLNSGQSPTDQIQQVQKALEDN